MCCLSDSNKKSQAMPPGECGCAVSADLWYSSSCLLYDSDVSLRWTLRIHGKCDSSMFLKPLGRVLCYQLKESGQTKLLHPLKPRVFFCIRSRGSCELLIVTFYIRAGHFGQCPRCICWEPVKWGGGCISPSVKAVWMYGHVGAWRVSSGCSLLLTFLDSLFIVEALLGGLGERVAVGMLPL